MCTQEELALFEQDHSHITLSRGHFIVTVPSSQRHNYGATIYCATYQEAVKARQPFLHLYRKKKNVPLSIQQIEGSNVNWDLIYSIPVNEGPCTLNKNNLQTYKEILKAGYICKDKMCLQILTPKGHKSIKLTDEDQVLKIAQTLQEAGYTRTIGRQLQKANNLTPCEDYAKDSKYIRFNGWSYGVSVPKQLHSKYGMTVKSFKDYEEAKKFRDEVLPYYKRRPSKPQRKEGFKNIVKPYKHNTDINATMEIEKIKDVDMTVESKQEKPKPIQYAFEDLHFVHCDEILILNKDTNTFVKTGNITRLELLKEIVGLGTANVVVLARSDIDGNFVEYSVLD